MADAFDLIVGSAYEGIMKPDPRIFRRTLERLDCPPEAAVFVDDMFANVEAARALGLWSIHYRAGMDLSAILGEFGVEIEK
jgi:HAD superfamily hydrolase (TIGR01509 family)